MMDKFEVNTGDDDLPLLFEPAPDFRKKRRRILLLVSGVIATIFVVVVVSVGVSSGVQKKKTAETTGHWYLESTHKPTDSLAVYTAKSTKTGLTVVLANTKSPVVRGFFCLATEAKNNWGLPHTLEHLIFMGSHNYPYKDVLDLLGNRCLADRTNAWTGTDHTCYTVSTAGSSGFINILPIYLDHILNPTLKDEDFLTEVHRVNPEGQDVGVVYSEMQDAEHDLDRILIQKLLDLLYPGSSGYNKETGGKLEDLRKYTNNIEVKKFHKKFYRPENLVLTITGEIELGKIQNALAIVEDRWLKDNDDKQAKFTRPWLAKLADVTSVVEEVEFPADDESVGSIYIGWRSTGYITEITEELSAQNILLTYLTEPHQGPLDLAIVNTIEPLAESISFDRDNFKKPLTTITMNSVPTKKLKNTVQVMDEVLNSILKDGEKGFEKKHMKTLHTIIDQQHLIIANDDDNDPSSSVQDASLINQLYGRKSEDFINWYKMKTEYLQFKNKTASYWLDIINRALVLAPRAVVLGKPSIKLQTKLEERKKLRLQERNKTLDREKLRKQEEAISNKKPPGEDILDKMPLASVEDIRFMKIETLKLSKSFPFKSHIDDVNSKFVQFVIVMNSGNLTEREKLLLPILIDLWKTSPQNKNGTIITKEQVTQKHNKFLINFDASFGVYGEFTESISFSARADNSNLQDAIEDIKNTLLFADINIQDIKSSIKQKLSSVPDLYMDAQNIQTTIENYLTYQNTTNIYHRTLIQQEPFLKKILSSGVNGIKTELQTIMEKLTIENNTFVYLALNKKHLNSNILKKLTNILNSGKNHEIKIENDEKQHPEMITHESKNVTEILGNSNNDEDRFKIINEYKLKKLANYQVAVGIAGTLSCFLSQTIAYNNTNWNDPEVASLEVLLEYISSRMYERVRGRGLTYSISMQFSITRGHIVLNIGRSSQMVKAVIKVKEIFKEYTSKDTNLWKHTLLDSAKGSVIYRRTSDEETVEDLELKSALSYMRNVDATWNRNQIKHVAKVELDDVVKAAQKFFPKFFDEHYSNTVMVCNKGALDEIVNKLKNEGLHLDKFNSVEDCIERLKSQ